MFLAKQLRKDNDQLKHNFESVKKKKKKREEERRERERKNERDRNVIKKKDNSKKKSKFLFQPPRLFSLKIRYSSRNLIPEIFILKK